MFQVFQDLSSSKLKDKQYKQKISAKSYKSEIKFSLILGVLNRALSNFLYKNVFHF